MIFILIEAIHIFFKLSVSQNLLFLLPLYVLQKWNNFHFQKNDEK